MSNTKEMLISFLFAAFYVVLFPLQMLPSLVVVLVGTASIWFWVSCALGLVALIVQNIKFPCIGTRLWSMGSVMALIAALWYFNYLLVRFGAM